MPTAWGRAAGRAVVAALLSGVLLATLAAAVPPAPVRDEMPGGAYRADGLFDPPNNAQGFYDPDTLPDGTTVRGMGATASVTFPYAANLGRTAILTLRLASDLPPAALPATATLRLNGGPGLPLLIGPDFQVVTATLDTRQTPNPYLDPAHIQVTLESAPRAVPGEPVKRGVLADWVMLQPQRDGADVAALAGAGTLGVLIVAGVAGVRFGARWALGYAGGTLASALGLLLTYSPRALPPWAEISLAGLAWTLGAITVARTRPLWGLGLAGLAGAMLLAGRIMGDWQLDDAYISYRYAWNLVQGSGLVYNPGEVVEGYTNFLWTVGAAGALLAGWALAATALAANIALSMGLLAITYRLAARLAGEHGLWPLLAAGLLALDDSLITYGARGSGMEALLLAVLVLAGVWCLWMESPGRRLGWRVAGGVLLAGAALTRPEGLALAGLVLVGRAWTDWRMGQRVGRPLLAALVPLLALVVPYQVWRISFYGYPFPNTFYAKTGATLALVERGLDHVAWFASEHWLPGSLVLIGGLVAGAAWWLRRRPPGAPRLTVPSAPPGLRPVLAVLVVAQLGYIAWVGGDYFPGWRFFVPILAPLVLLAGETLRYAAQHPAQRLPRPALVGAVAFAVALYGVSLAEPQRVITDLTRLHTGYVDRWGSVGLWLRENTPPTTLTAVKGAGAVAYYSQRPILDALGLNDLYIGHLAVADMGTGKAGHEKADPAYVLSRRPTYLLELETYMAPVQAQLAQGYTQEYVRAPTGVLFGWWRRTAP